jgi:hypothetical protein
MEIILTIAVLAILVFVFSQSAIIFVLRKENQELVSELEKLKTPF